MRAKSQQRIASSDVFAKVKKNAERYKMRKDQTEYPLEFNQYSKHVDKIEEAAKEFKDIFPEIKTLKIENLPTTKEVIAKDEAKKKRNDDWLKSIQSDAYIEECLKILKDMK